MKGIYLDGEAGLLDEHWAVVRPTRRERKRFSENCVSVVASEEEARGIAAGIAGARPARVLGPSRSSEGFRLYYLVRWLDR